MSNESVLNNSESVGELVKVINDEEIVSWSNKKKEDFVALFDSRSRVAQYILICTGENIHHIASSRQFIIYNIDVVKPSLHSLFDSREGRSLDYYENRVGGRPTSELARIAQERANLIISELPSLKKALEVIDPVTSSKLAEIDEINKKAGPLINELAEIKIELNIDDLPQETTIAELKKIQKKRIKTRNRLVTELNELGEEKNILQRAVDNALIKGVPELNNAIINVINKCYDQAKGLSEVSRRINEKVRFGDSETAMSLLTRFEKDEETIDDGIKAGFKEAIERLKVSPKMLKKKKIKGIKENGTTAEYDVPEIDTTKGGPV